MYPSAMNDDPGFRAPREALTKKSRSNAAVLMFTRMVAAHRPRSRPLGAHRGVAAGPHNRGAIGDTGDHRRA